MSKTAGHSAIENERPALGYIPEVLKTLAMKVVRAFYSDEASVVMTLLIRHFCLKEEDIVLLMQLPQKMIKSALNALEADHLVRSKQDVDIVISLAAPTRKCTYWYIDYEAVVFITQYKLDRMWHRINEDAAKSLNNTVSECTDCERYFTALDITQLFDVTTGKFLCDCGNELIRKFDDSAAHANAIKSSMNVQTQEFVKLQHEIDKIVISETVLKPKPSRLNISQLKSEMQSSQKTASIKQSPHDAKAYQPTNPFEERYSIRIIPPGARRKEYKPQPIWTRSSTVVDATAAAQIPKSGCYADSNWSGSAFNHSMSNQIPQNHTNDLQTMERLTELESVQDQDMYDENGFQVIDGPGSDLDWLVVHCGNFIETEPSPATLELVGDETTSDSEFDADGPITAPPSLNAL